MADVLVVASKVKAIIASKGFRTSADVFPELSKDVEARCLAAVAKAAAAGRKTVMAEDLSV